MKKLALLALSLLSLNAVAAEPSKHHAVLDRFTVAPELFNGKPVRHAEISVNDDHTVATLTLEIQMTSCPVGAHCIIGPIFRTETIELPVVEFKQDAVCGVTRIVAELDKRPVDGAFKRLMISDNTHLCIGSIESPIATTVSYEFAISSPLSSITARAYFSSNDSLDFLFDRH